jgi:hypothetical protein
MTKVEHDRTDETVAPEDIANAMAVYSADGQVDDETGGDAAAEQMRARQDNENGTPTPEAGHIGPV